MPARHARLLLLVILAAITSGACAQSGDAEFIRRMDQQFATIERLLGTLRHVAVTTEEGGEVRTRLTSEAWFVPGDAVETPVKILLWEDRGGELRETAFWLDQGHLFLVKERAVVRRETGVEVTEHRRFFDGGTLVRLESRTGVGSKLEEVDFTGNPFIPIDLPADADAEAVMLEEIALETASQLAPVAVTNRPVRWE